MTAAGLAPPQGRLRAAARRVRRAPAAAGLALALLAAGCDSVEERAEGHYLDGLELLEEGEPVKASLEFRNTVRLDEDHVGANFELARFAEDRQNYSAAIARYGKVVSLDASHVEAHVRLATLLLAFDRIDEAVASTVAAAQLAPNDVDVVVLEGALALNLGELDRAREKASRATELAPEDGDVWLLLGAISRREGDAGKALAQVDEGLRRDPDNVKAHLFRLDLLQELGRTEAIGGALRRLVEIKPGEIGFWEGLARWQLRTKRFEEVEPTLRRISELNRDDAARALDIVRLVGAMQGREAAYAELDRLIGEREGTAAERLRIARAEFLIGDGRPAEARADLEALIERAGLSQEALTARTMLARLLLGDGGRQRALELVEETLGADATNAEALTLRGRIRILGEDYDAAIEDLRAAESQQPDVVETIRLLAVAHERNGNPDLAAARLAEAVEVSGHAPEPVLDYARHLLEEDRPGFARDLLERALEASPDDVRLIEAYARLRLAAGEFSAVERIASQLRESPESAGLGDRLMAAALSGQERYDETIRVLRGAYDEADRPLGYLAALVATHLRRDDMEAAERLVAEALERRPEDTGAIRLKGTLALVRGEPDAARAAFEKAVETAPGEAANHLALFRLLARTGEREAARAALEAGIGRTDNPVLRLNRAMLLEREGEIERAIADYERLYEARPGSELIANNLASLITDSDPTEAEIDRAYRIARRLRETEVPHFKDTYGWLLHLRGDDEGALPRLEEAAAALPDNPVVQYHLGVVRAALGRTAGAREALERALALAEGRPVPQVADARARLARLPAPAAGD